MTPEQARQYLSYEPATGVLRWRAKISAKTVVGREAGSLSPTGYVLVGFQGKRYYAHRIAWLMQTGEWPTQIDHKDGNGQNNAWSNLREATRTQNTLNAKRARNNTTGYKGVSYHKGAGRWAAYIYVGNKTNYLGLFDTPEEAHAAYLRAAHEIEPDFVRSE